MTGKGEELKNYVKLSKEKVLDIAKQELDSLKQSFETIKNDPKKIQGKTNKLEKINNIIQNSELDLKDKEHFVNALDDLKKSIDSNNLNKENLNHELDKVTELLESMIHRELIDLENEIWESSIMGKYKSWKKHRIRPEKSERRPEIRDGIIESGEKIPKLIEDAKNDKSRFIRNVVARLLERANS